MKITFIGGDARTVALCRLFEQAGDTVLRLFTMGQENDSPDLAAALRSADVLVLPLPVSRDGIHPTAPAGLTPPTLTEIFEEVGRDCLVLGGMLSPRVRAVASAAETEITDYYMGEELIRKNAIATAEAAVAMAALELPVTIMGNHFAILGAGRIAMHTLSLLRAMGARVSLFARSPAAREKAQSLGATVYPIEATVAPDIPPTVRAVFSTVPAMLYPRGAKMPSRGTYFYDLGGGAMDAEAAREAGIILPPSAALPGKYSPESAAEYLFAEIKKLIRVRKEGAS